MVRRGVNLERKELPDGFLGAHKREAKRKRSEKFVQIATDKSAIYKSGKKIPDNPIDSVEKKFRKPKKKPAREETLIEKSIEEIKPEVNESLIEEINNLGKKITNITTEIDDNYYKKPFLSIFHSEELEHFKERGYSILDSLNKPEKKNGKEIEKIILSLEHYLAEGMLLLNGLRRIYQSHLDNREAGGEEILLEEEIADPKQLDADINRNLSPVYSEKETPTDALEYKQKYGRKMRPPISKQADIVSDEQLVDDKKNNEPIIEKQSFLILENNTANGVEKNMEESWISEKNELAEIVVESYLKAAIRYRELFKIGNISKLKGDTDEERKNNLNAQLEKLLTDGLESQEKFSKEEKKYLVNKIMAKYIES
jgi:hypothetical protein